MSKKRFLYGAVMASLLCGMWGTAAADTAEDPLYEQVITGDMETDQYWQDAGVLAKIGQYKFKGDEDQSIKPVFTGPVHNGIYAVIAPTIEQDITIDARNKTFTIDADGTGLDNPEIYAIYNNQNALVDLDGNKMDYVISVDAPEGATGAVIYAATEEGLAEVHRDRGTVGMTVVTEHPGIVGMHAGKNGLIIGSSARDLIIKTKGNYALKAVDGGKIYLRGVVETDDHAAMYAANGGEIRHGYMYIANTGNLMEGSYSDVKGDVFSDEGGIIDLHFKEATWDGNSIGTGKLDITLINDSVWNGAGSADSLFIDRGSLWNIGAAEGLKNKIGVLTGGANSELAGTIDMTHASGLEIADMSGNLALAYTYDAATDAFKGGKVTIQKATQNDAGNAYIIVRTDKNGINLDDDATVERLLNDLAGNITYTAYTEGERNLDGRVEIAEGLTSSATLYKLADMSFKSSTGQGMVSTMPQLFGDMITGTAEKDQKYIDAGVTTDAKKFDFHEDTKIRTLYNTPKDDPLAMNFSGSIIMDEGNEVVIDMHGNDLSLLHQVQLGEMQQHVGAAIYVPKAGSVTIDNPGAIDLNIIGDYYYLGGISAGYRSGYSESNPPSEIIINNDNDPANAVKIRGKFTSGSGFDMNFTGIKTFAGGVVDIKGLVDINSGASWGLGGTGEKSLISVGGGKIVTDNYSAIDSYSDATVHMNMIGEGDAQRAGTNPVYIIGAAQPFGGDYVGTWAAGNIAIGLNTSDSYWQGVAMTKYSTRNKEWIGNVKVHLANGATWNNAQNDWTPDTPTELAENEKKHDSRVETFIGSDSEENSGLILHNTMQPLTFNNYSGHTTIAYKHGDQVKYNYWGDPTGIDAEDVVIGGDVTINNAEENSSIALRIDSEGINIEDEAEVREWLNKLANKLYYKGYVDGERNLEARAEIAEGLTAYSAAWMKCGDMSFKDNNGQGYLAEEEDIKTNPSSMLEPRPKVVHVGKDDAERNMRRYYISDDQLYIFEHNPDDPSEVYGGGITIDSADPNSRIRLRTDNDGIDIHDTDEVRDALNGLAGKLTYKAYVNGEENLNGQAEIAEGLTASSAMMKFGDIKYRAETGQGYFDDVRDIRTEDPEILYGPKETAMMRGAKSAMAGTILAWRQQNDDLDRRMGDLRDGLAEDGAWARIYGGSAKYDKDNVNYDSDFIGVQAGFDRIQDNGWRTGIAFGYQDGDQDYIFRGTGDTRLISLAAYGTKHNDNGSYVDVVLKGSHVKNEFTVFNDMGYKLEGDYNTWGLSAGLEVGKKNELDDGRYWGYFGKLTYGYLDGKDYDAKSDYANGKLMRVEQDSVNSFIGRIGMNYGQQSGKANYFLKGAIAHEFAGDMTTTFSAKNEPTSKTKHEFDDTWFELGIGGTYNLNADTYLYGNLERSFGGDMETDWRADLGIRWMF